MQSTLHPSRIKDWGSLRQSLKISLIWMLSTSRKWHICLVRDRRSSLVRAASKFTLNVCYLRRKNTQIWNPWNDIWLLILLKTDPIGRSPRLIWSTTIKICLWVSIQIPITQRSGRWSSWNQIRALQITWSKIASGSGNGKRISVMSTTAPSRAVHILPSGKFMSLIMILNWRRITNQPTFTLQETRTRQLSGSGLPFPTGLRTSRKRSPFRKR